MYRYKPKLGRPLTPTESAMLLRVVDGGESITQIAKALSKSASTIATHLGRARVKLGAKTLEQAAVFFDRQRRQPVPT